jgi:hypothetical protein
MCRFYSYIDDNFDVVSTDNAVAVVVVVIVRSEN